MLLLVFLGGMLTIVCPCVLPVLPLVLARTGQSFRRDTAPLLAGLALVFAAVASVATLSAGWIVRASEIGRAGAVLLLALVGVSLLVPATGEIIARPFVRLGAWVDARAGRLASRTARNIVLGGAMGLLWAPCAGPILGLVIATAAAAGIGTSTVLLFGTFALGAATSLTLVMLLGESVRRRVRLAGVADLWIRRALGVLVLVTVTAIGTGSDARLFALATGNADTRVESRLIEALGAAPAPADRPDIGAPVASLVRRRSLDLPVEGSFPGFEGATAWINSPPLTPAALRGKVVLVDFWTFECYNCLNALPHVKELEAKYRDQGFVVIGVHTPEFPQERDEANVREAVRRLGVTYPVVMDNAYQIWNRFGNQYWPAAYYIDQTGKIRFHHFGEGLYDEQDQVVQQLLAEAHAAAAKSSN